MNPVWGYTFQIYFDKIIVYQYLPNKIVKIIAKATWNDLPSYLYSELDKLEFTEIYQLEVPKIMHYIDTKSIVLL